MKFLFLLPMFVTADYLRSECSLCKKYNPTISDPFWFKWFEHFCYSPEEQKSITCFYYNCQLDINTTTFWKEWKKCKCVKEGADYLGFVNDDQKQIIEFYVEEL